jgi:hypothetical protein
MRQVYFCLDGTAADDVASVVAEEACPERIEWVPAAASSGDAALAVPVIALKAMTNAAITKVRIFFCKIIVTEWS